MYRTKHRVALVAALLALLTALLPASAAHASPDPNPPYVASSQPGGYPLFGYHHDQLSPTVNCWAGMQRRGNGDYRLWLKCAGNGNPISVEYRNLHFYDHGYADFAACQTTFCVKGPGAKVYYVGTWHPVAEEVSVKALSVNVRYQGGASTGQKCVASYRMLRGQRYPIASPTC